MQPATAYKRSNSEGIAIDALLYRVEEQFQNTSRDKVPGYAHICQVYTVESPKVKIVIDMITRVTREGWFKQVLGFKDPKFFFVAKITIEPEDIRISTLIKEHLGKKLRSKYPSTYQIIINEADTRSNHVLAVRT